MRQRIPVGVAYGSDVDQVCEVLLEVGKSHPDTREQPEPRVRMRGFGASSLDFELLVWIENPEDGRSRLVRLTPKGKALAEEIVDALIQANKALIGGILESDETEQLATLLRKLSLGLEARKSSPAN